MDYNNECITRNKIQNQYHQTKGSNYLENQLQNKEFLNSFDKQFSFYERLLSSKVKKNKCYKKTIGEDSLLQKIFNTNLNKNNVHVKYTIKLNNIKDPCEKRIIVGDDMKKLIEFQKPFVKNNSKSNVDFEYIGRTSTPRKGKLFESGIFEDIFFTKPNLIDYENNIEPQNQNVNKSINKINQAQEFIDSTSTTANSNRNILQYSTGTKNLNFLNQSDDKNHNQSKGMQMKNNMITKVTCKSTNLNNKSLRKYIIEQSKIPCSPVEFPTVLKNLEKNRNLSSNLTKKNNFNSAEWSVKDKISFFNKLGKTDQYSKIKEMFSAPQMEIKKSSFFNENNNRNLKSFNSKNDIPTNNMETKNDFSIKTKIAAFESLCKRN
ncbi:putative uncharacterized protein DDB_G0282133 [Condylostylus longicornis]|uniref:putative uncharacterized protein DDB_G0282133 n=1 Tax=Condylostylus longicornis TaxID=2530218 RepID=UPI00244DAFDE|nr:putative uncharacterized protein DDB_G0282133 [Condylostylus longicornis]